MTTKYLLNKTFHPPKMHCHLHSMHLVEQKMDCFGMAFGVLSACEVLGLDDVHLCVSEDHVWAVHGEDGSLTSEITWHGINVCVFVYACVCIYFCSYLKIQLSENTTIYSTKPPPQPKTQKNQPQTHQTHHPKTPTTSKKTTTNHAQKNKTQPGKGTEDRRGHAISTTAPEKSWLYGEGMVCDRSLELGLLVVAINPVVNSALESVEMASIQKVCGEV